MTDAEHGFTIKSAELLSGSGFSDRGYYRRPRHMSRRLMIRSARLHAEAARMLGLDKAAPMIAMRAQSLARAAMRAKRERRAEYT